LLLITDISIYIPYFSSCTLYFSDCISVCLRRQELGNFFWKGPHIKHNCFGLCEPCGLCYSSSPSWLCRSSHGPCVNKWGWLVNPYTVFSVLFSAMTYTVLPIFWVVNFRSLNCYY
jgi:hypothetical protein